MINSHRLLVRGHQVEYIPEVEERIIKENESAYFYKYAFYATLGLLIFILFIQFVGFIKKKNKIRKNKKRQIALEKQAMENIKDEGLINENQKE